MFGQNSDPLALFRGKMWYEFVEEQKEKAIDDISGINATVFESNTLAEIKQNLRDKYLIDKIILLKDSKEVELTEEKLEYYDEINETLGYDGCTYIPGYKITIHIPFLGDERLFRITPSSCVLTYRMGNVVRNMLSVNLQLYERNVDEEGKAINDEINKLIASIDSEICHINRDVEIFNKELLQIIDKKIDIRLSKINKIQKIKTSLKIPFEKTSVPSPLNKVSFSVKKIAPLANKPGEANAYISDNDYESVLEILRACGQSLEANTAAKGRGEEEIRDIFLTCLNSSIKPGAGFAGGELFHVSGKTDIAIPFENKATFIAECKLWQGEKYINEGIDQLISYSSWRDAKLALLIFNKNSINFSMIQNKIQNIFKTRMGFVKEIPQREGEWRFVLQKPDDSSRHITIQVFAFDLKKII